ncbi:hypothetical protein DCAR_0208637 [Daucus carota subsp. sativus]|uniref:Uncharacterized protein n=1 Tax=Daucus carota subsp. sativus TaxID=79200 RepID=A0AAF1AN82_DAUCS|nr:hypothetical protein DCAR_0208637 [Daucus carota subsp. sativus]
MDFPLLSPLVLSIGLLFSFSALLVQSLEKDEDPVKPHRSPPQMPPPPVSPPPPLPHHHHISPPPPHKKNSHHTNQPIKSDRSRNGGGHKRKNRDLGKKVGLWFIGVAAGLQVCVLGFLVHQRWQFFGEQDFL